MGGASIEIHQDTTVDITPDNNTAYKIWDGSFLLARHLDNKDYFKPGYFSNKRCIELGAGCRLAIENLDIENPLVLSILELHSSFKTRIVFGWVPSHIGIRGNELADKAAKTALKGRKINIPLPFTDFRHIIKQYVRKQWSDFWSLQSENKLHAVQPALGCSMWSCRERRREEIVLCLLRIGHSFLIHRFASWLEKIHQSVSPAKNA
ncbi:hypothetical protein LSH36_372g01028 [Paralvinella palmiformis]|uniref:RNase H type-1 domain-containing protein n=1 Tax=Paralvinella palmiformis TaxID=53620 RepID=A0AAD9JEL5_9ANNE|nr:hypothetical protein LSH36_372g01028 [Paralvinella palmiformis]